MANGQNGQNGQQGQQGQQGSQSTFNPQIDLTPTGNPQRDIAKYLQVIAMGMQRNPNGFNFGNIRRAPTESQSSYAENSAKWKFEERHSQPKYRSSGNLLEDFEAGLKDQLMDSLAGGSFKKSMQNALDTFAKEFGMDLRDLPREFGKKVMSQFMDKTGLGDTVKKGISKLSNSVLDGVGKNILGSDNAGKLKNVVSSFLNKGGSSLGSAAQGALASGASTGAGALATSTTTTAAAGAGTGAAAGAAGAGTAGAGVAAGGMSALAATGWGALIIAILYTIYKITEPALKSFAEVLKATGKAFSREENMRKKRIENARKRLEADMEWMAKRPFEILEEAAKAWEDTWDKNLRTIGQTQGYDKESVYALYESYAKRLREDKLDSVINATDIVDKLASVLDSGLSGIAAEEFSYIATKLGAAIPTQDFFQYADVYASLAANAISQGKSQSEALSYANSQLEQFASNLLYSSRELAGGFSTGLKNSSDLLSNAVKIAQSARTNNASEISGTLTSVSAIIGAVAPDLASSLVDNIVQAAIGGNNNSSIVALRSLAGINAGNTEFLQAMAKDPQGVFSKLFSNLAQMQSMSPDNYMEVAEGLADVFGIDKAAFARVDFNYLAQAISAMNTNNNSLDENLKLLASGQTTTSAEQLKAQEINRVILDEGLAYVIDSEAGRMVQEHMWQEQIANELAENEYAVSLQGRSLELMESIKKVVSNIMDFLNPFGFIKKGVDGIIASVREGYENEADLKEILELGAVGRNSKSYYNLTTRGQDLKLVSSLVEMMGGKKGNAYINSIFGTASLLNNVAGTAGSILNAVLTGGASLAGNLAANNYDLQSGHQRGFYLTSQDWMNSFGPDSVAYTHGHSKVRSGYTWGMVGKTVAKALQSSGLNTATYSKIENSGKSASDLAVEESNNRVKEFLDSAATALANNPALKFVEWIKTSKDFGISDLEDALIDYGSSMSEVKEYFESHEASQGAAVEENRKKDEEQFRKETRDFWDFKSGTSGIFQTAMWVPFFGDGRKYDSRMDAVDLALSNIQSQLGSPSEHTVISGIEELSRKLGDDSKFTVISILTTINDNIYTTFMNTSKPFQKCLADWIRYIAASSDYTKTVNKSTAWSDLKAAEQDQQTEATLALANALRVFSAEELQKMDPQLQTNVLLGEIVVILQSIMQQNNTQAGGLSLIDTMSALGLGLTK